MELLPLVCLCLLSCSGDARVRVLVEQDSDAVLPCLIGTNEDLSGNAFDWRKDESLKEVFYYDSGSHYNNGRTGQDGQFIGRVSHFQDQLQNGDASIKIRNTKMADSGNYSCIFPHLQSQTSIIELVVARVRVLVEQDSDAVLPCLIGTNEDLSGNAFDWRKDESLKEVFYYDSGSHYNNGRTGQDGQFIGRVSHFQDQLMNGDASIKIRNTKMADSGNYSCIFPRLQSQTSIIELVVVQVLRDRTGENIPAVRVVVEEDSDAVLPCSISTEGSLEGKLFDWMKDGQKEVFLYNAGIHYNNDLSGQDEQFKGRVSHFQDQLKNGDASIKIQNTKMADSGIYSCDFPLLDRRQTFYIELVVGAAAKLFVTALAQINDGFLLQCEAHGVPRPTVEWKDSDNNILPAEETKISDRGGRLYVTVKTTVTKTDNYRCVATQETLSHQVAAVTSVYIQS